MKQKRGFPLLLSLLLLLSLFGCAKEQTREEKAAQFAAEATSSAGGDAETPTVTAESLGLADGGYTAEVTLTGGTGKASVSSPAALTVKDGRVTAAVVWSSSNYDYMIVDGVKYDPVTTEGGSEFEIPVAGFDWAMPVTADTVAMSTPHEIAYTLTFDSSSLARTAE